jgi:putative aminopeptidase FrvX
MRLSRGGMTAGLLSVPPRYMRTPNELLSLEDLENSAAMKISFLFSSSYALKCSFHFA